MLAILLVFTYLIITLDNWSSTVITDDPIPGYVTKQGIEGLVKIYGNVYFDGKNWQLKMRAKK